jgi:hypothetical protein
MLYSRLLLLLALLSGASAPTLRGQANSCRTDADTAAFFVARVKQMYAASDTAYLKTQGDPVAAPNDIVLVTNQTTCSAGLSVYNTGSGRSLGSAYVVAVGSQGFVLIDPAVRMGEFTILYIYDMQWQLKRSIAG